MKQITGSTHWEVNGAGAKVTELDHDLSVVLRALDERQRARQHSAAQHSVRPSNPRTPDVFLLSLRAGKMPNQEEEKERERAKKKRKRERGI